MNEGPDKDGILMPKFDMGAAWEDSMTLLRSYSGLTWAIAAVFFFLPTLAVSWFGPTPIEPAAGATFDQIMAAMGANVRQGLPYQLLVALIAAIGGVGILRLWLSRTGVSVGEALTFAAKMAPTVIAVQLILFVALVLAVLILFAPGIAAGRGGAGVLLLVVGLLIFLGLSAYFWGRLSTISVVIADRALHNPFAAIREAWALTKGNGWRIFLFLFLVTLVILIIAAILGGIVAAIVGTGSDAGRILIGLVEGGVAAVSGMVTLAIVAATYRQLAIRESGEIFG